ncbi:hypothetical protein BIU98_16185 [Curtobacterium sp. MMLR14_010]|nr:hypothetical protein BIU98_16185 [Curtobacterium sp. MMLR14_010]
MQDRGPTQRTSASDPSVCPSTFDRWHCDRPVGHDGQHRSARGTERTEWNDRASGRRLSDL